MRLQNKVAIVTGASRGIGKAIALAFAKEGAHVIVVARTQKESKLIPGTIHKTVEEIYAIGGRAITIKTDITNDLEVETMVRKTMNDFKRIDILVNNAATNSPALFKDIPLKNWDRILSVNLRGAVLCTKAVLPVMMGQREGHIINISSIVTQEISHKPMTGLAYDVSKAALNRFTMGLAEELKSYHIAVNALMPDNTDTEGWAYLNPDVKRAGWQKPELWGKYAVFVAVQDPKVFTGRLLTHDVLCGNVSRKKLKI